MTVEFWVRAGFVMRVGFSSNERIIARSAALLLLGGLTAGCSSGTMRFQDGTDGLFTGSTSNQRAIINNQSQPYPGDVAASASREAVQPVDVSKGSVSRSNLPPVSTAASGGATMAATAAAAAPVIRSTAKEGTASAARKVAALEPPLDNRVTNSVAAGTAAVSAGEETIKGWSKAGGTQITAKDGETVYNLSRRFGVPADVLMRMNGLSPENGLKVGQRVVIPTYVYSSKAGVSAPDNDPKTAAAKSSRGEKEPAPQKSAQEAVKTAVLPKTPKLKEGEVAEAKALDAKQPKAQPAKDAYTVAEGDSLAKIARKTGISVADLKQANGLKDGNIRIGQVLKLKAGSTTLADARPAEGKTAEAKKPGVDKDTKTGSISAAEQKPAPQKVAAADTQSGKAIEQAEKEDKATAPGSTGISRMRWPVTGRVVSGYGSSSGGRNDGIDIAVPNGTAVKAAENGVVIYAGDGLKEFGNTVLVRHDNGLVTVYGYASELKVQRGQKVKRGEQIAVSGMSGNAKSPKLHFEVRKNSAPVDPKTFLE